MIVIIICKKEVKFRRRRKVSLQGTEPWRKVKEGNKWDKVRKTEKS